jgi:DnaD/phage-associated family protein
VILAGQTIDKLIRAGDGDATLLYLYILKTRGLGTTAQAAAAMGKSSGWIASAMAVLSRLGLVEIEGGGAGANAGPHVPQMDEPPDEPPRYTIEELKRELQSGSSFASVVEETQRSLGRQLSPDELMRLFGIFDALRLPPEVILQLITHCISESRRSGGGRAPSLRYIEKAAYTWEREGINTLERAEEYIKGLEARRSQYGNMKRTLQIKDREFSATEKQYVDGWIDMGFGPEVVAAAYDKTLVKTGKMAWGYMDTILKSWHGKGIHSLKDVQEKDRWPSKGGDETKGGAGGFDAPNQEDIVRMQRLLDKIKKD